MNLVMHGTKQFQLCANYKMVDSITTLINHTAGFSAFTTCTDDQVTHATSQVASIELHYSIYKSA